jgi:hypothetical protein
MTTGTEPTLTTDERGWYERIINILASVVLVLIWKLIAWGLTFTHLGPDPGMTADQWFAMLIAIHVALGTKGKRQ